ncbi:MAG: XRE family transcriptional regulator, partial [Anaerolineae bacterium]|nr:XRE family transcriptional regulator [Anaerolineae bacterium]
EELATRIGYATTTIRRVETDELRPSKVLAEKLADVLDLPSDERADFVRFARGEPSTGLPLPQRLAGPGGRSPAPSPTPSLPPVPPAMRHNLPVQLSSFIGRKKEGEIVRQMLRQPDVRLLTLTGPGGTGKTRLALQVAADVLDDFPDGVYFVDLAPVTVPDDIVSAISQTLDVREQGGRLLIDILKAYLRGKCLLLLLDNFEQIVAVAPHVAELLAHAPGIKILVTSRIALHVRGEHEYAVPPLALPDLKRLPPLERLTQYEAIRLFIERAEAVTNNFSVTNENAPAIAEICHRLDGLPLAIELAAARSRLFSPQAMLGRLERRLKILTDGPRDLPARQQTLHRTIAWSYDLLTDTEKTLFRRLAVFVGGFTLDAVEQVIGEGVGEVIDGVSSLVEKSLLRRMEQPGGDMRFSMLETLLEFAVERLLESGETDALRRQHAQYFLNLAEQASLHWQGTQPRRWVEQLEQEYDNLLAVFRRAHENGNAALMLRLAGALDWFWFYKGQSSEVVQWVQKALALPNAAVPTPERARTLQSLGTLAYWRGDFMPARLSLEASIVTWRQVGNSLGLAETLAYISRVAWDQGDYPVGEKYALEALHLYEELGNRWGVAGARQGLGLIALGLGQTQQARTMFEECLATYRLDGNQLLLGLALLNMGRTFIVEGEYQMARPWIEESLATVRRIKNVLGIYMAAHELGFAVLPAGEVDFAYSLHLEALLMARDIGAIAGLCACLVGLAQVAAARRQLEQAACLLAAIHTGCSVLGAPLTPSNRVEYERTVAAVQRAMSESQYNQAWAEGQAMTVEEAVQYALATGDLE